MRKPFIALLLALVLLLPGLPAPARAGSFSVSIPPPLIAIIQGSLASGGVSGLACIGTGGSTHPWLMLALEDVDTGFLYSGDDADKFSDNTGAKRTKLKDSSSGGGSSEIVRLFVDGGNTPILSNVKAKASSKTSYVVDDEFGFGSAGAIVVADQTNGQRASVVGSAIKLTGNTINCNIDVDVETGRPIGAHLSGRTDDGSRIDVRVGGR